MSDFTYRTLTMKRFAVPQENPFFELGEEELESKYGNYVSFSGYHFLKISPCKKVEIASAYQNLQTQRTQKTIGTYVLQTLTLLGKEGDFWKDEPDLLFVTLLQTRNLYTTAVNVGQTLYRTLEKGLEVLFREAPHADSSRTPDFALYYTYDFCDFVLFAKNVDIRWYNDLLWSMTTSKDDAFQCVRDTYSLYAFHTQSLLRAMYGQCPKMLKSMSMDVTLLLSVYSSSAFDALEKKLGEQNIVLEKSSIFSRYDMALRVKGLNGEQIAFLLKELDHTYSQTPPPFGGFELMPCSECPGLDPDGKDPWYDSEFTKVFKPVLEENLRDVSELLKDYAQESSRSLRELLVNGFSIEFLLGIIPPYFQGLKLLSSPPSELDDTEKAKKLTELSLNAQLFFNALNTLKLSMMHGERRFIQAPAFNASYFDVPPKLFAYYAAILHLTAELYRDNSGKYCFLMVPDFRPEINVLPLPKDDTKEIEQRLAIVYLSEHYFYDPLEAICLILHESAHYLSNRHRENRAREIFFCISATLLARLPIGVLLRDKRLDALMDKNSLLGILADEFAKTMEEEYLLACPDEHIKFSFVNIQSFLQDNQYGIRLLINSFLKEKMIRACSRKIFRLQDEESISEICTILKELEVKAGKTCFLSKFYEAEYSRRMACEILVAQVMTQVDEFFETEEASDHCVICENLLFTFREAFADHRMLQALNIAYAGSQIDKKAYTVLYYESLHEDTRKGRKELDFDYTIRHDAVLRTHFPESSDTKLKKPEKPETDQDERENWLAYYIQEIAIRGIHRYLDSCKMDNPCPETLCEAVQIFSTNDSERQYWHVINTLVNYRKHLIECYGVQ